MKKTFLPLALILALAMTLITGCAEKDPLAKRSCSPVLKIESAEGKAGETVGVTVSLSGADGKWSASGIHFAYDERLTAAKDELNQLMYEKGNAVDSMTDFIAVDWVDNRTDELINDKQNSIFFCSIGEDGSGNDGDIATFNFIIPQDAEVGTVYDLNFFYMDNDMFTNAAKEEEMQKYAVQNWINGSITVTE